MSYKVEWKETPQKKKSELTRGEQILTNLQSEEYRKFLFENPDLVKWQKQYIPKVEFEEAVHLCWYCNEEVTLPTSRPKIRVYCKGCKDEHERDHGENLKRYVELKIRVMYERALKTLEKQLVVMAHYKEAAEAVLEKALKEPEKFASTQEMIAAIELIQNEIKVILQKRIGNYTADMVVPKYNVVLEVDGHTHKHKKVYDNKRDIAIRSELGPEWEVIRIPTQYIDTNINGLIPAIKAIYKYKQKIRRDNNGIIPVWFSQREYEHYKELFG